MPIIDTHQLAVLEKRPGWRGRLFHSPSMTFAHWDFDAGSTIHEHSHEQEEVWHVLEGELEVTIDGVAHTAGSGMVAIVPADALHSVRAVSDGKAIVVDYPLRTDFA
jgi:quercetin dioxygenase-like cupin family protein